MPKSQRQLIRSTAIKIILTHWVLNWLSTGLKTCIFEMFHEIGIKSEFAEASISYFGTASPTDKQIWKFHDHYQVIAQDIRKQVPELILGQTTLDEIIINHFIQ